MNLFKRQKKKVEMGTLKRARSTGRNVFVNWDMKENIQNLKKHDMEALDKALSQFAVVR